MSELVDRLEYLVERLRTSYDGIGHSSGRPYVYFVYPPDQERALLRLADEHLRDGGTLRFVHVDLLRLTVESLASLEEQSRQLLEDPARHSGAKRSVLKRWARALGKGLAKSLAEPASPGRPVVVLRGLAALHPLGNPTELMEAIAEDEPRDPATNRIVPIVLLVPGTRPPGTSRTYRFLGLEQLEFSFYRGEEV